MRLLFASLLFVSLQGAAIAQGSPSVDQFLTPSIRYLIDAYSHCAAQHLGELARIDPSRPFEAVEATLKPVCGSFYDEVRSQLLTVGFTREQTNWVINKTYLRNAPGYRAAYQQAVVGEYQRREAVRQAELQRQRDEQIKVERTKQLEVATQEHLACLKQQMKDVGIYSSEAADVLAGVLMTKCAEGERKRVDLYSLVYNLAPTQVRQVVAEETKKLVLADIVTFRATMNKVIIENTKPSHQDPPKGSDASL